MSKGITKAIAEQMLAGVSGTAADWATATGHPRNNISAILTGMVKRGAVITADGNDGTVYSVGDAKLLNGARGKRTRKIAPTDAPAVTTEHLCEFFISTDWSIQILDPDKPDDPIRLTQREWRVDLLPFLVRLNAALEPA